MKFIEPLVKEIVIYLYQRQIPDDFIAMVAQISNKTVKDIVEGIERDSKSSLAESSTYSGMIPTELLNCNAQLPSKRCVTSTHEGKETIKITLTIEGIEDIHQQAYDALPNDIRVIMKKRDDELETLAALHHEGPPDNPFKDQERYVKECEKTYKQYIPILRKWVVNKGERGY